MNSKTNTLELIRIAIIAVGGDGGGVITQWIIKLAEQKNYWAQSTTIAGVAQRTGSTVYYIELCPLKSLLKNKESGETITPVLAQMPEQGNVDIVIATEIMEAGRAIQRGFVNELTTIIFSTHRSLAIAEKEIPGDGIRNGKDIFQLTEKYSDKCIYGNFKILADQNKSVISSALFGALCASSKLPFAKENFESVIKKSGVGVTNSLATFNEAYNYVINIQKNISDFSTDKKIVAFENMPLVGKNKQQQQIIDKIKQKFPNEVHNIVYKGVEQLVEWQNMKWAERYLTTLEKYIQVEKKFKYKRNELLQNIARYLAIAMSYDDLVNVADIKTRAERWQAVYKQVEANQDEVVKVVDYLHPGFDEICGFLPNKIGKFFSTNPKYKKWFIKYFDKDRRMNTHNLFSFLMLYIIGGMKRWRMITLRHHEEMDNINKWLNRIDIIVNKNYELAVQVAKTYRLKKGYGDTYQRGDSKFKQINEFALANKNKAHIEEHLDYLIKMALHNNSTDALKDKIKSIVLAES